MGLCVVCDHKTSGSLEFCKVCYRTYKGEIKEKKPWVRVLKNEAQRERRRKERDYDNVSLDAIMEYPYDREQY